MRPFFSLEIDMASYQLRPSLSFCHAGGRLIFLDVEADRYLTLPPAQERALIAYLDADPAVGIDVSALVAGNVLVKRPDRVVDDSPEAAVPARSAMEIPIPDSPPRLRDAAEVVAIVLAAKLRLELLPFAKVLDRVARGRRSAGVLNVSSPAPEEDRLIRAAAVFRQVRLFVPVGMRCLIDSLALVRFLQRRNLHANIVFGVAIDPFSAHCWVQAGDLVLNDTLGNVASHIPIRVV